MNKEYIFVYGSLQRAFEDKNEYTRLFHQKCTWLYDAKVKGSLYWVDWYPGLVLTGDTDVLGEVYTIDHPDIMVALDAYENAIAYSDWKEGDESVYDYRRTIITLDNQSIWVYEYMKEVSQLQPIPDGNYRKAVYGLE